MNNEPRKLKRLVIKEELVELCYMALEKMKASGQNISLDPIAAAIVLQQMLYWGERVRDFDDFIIEENNRAEEEGLVQKELVNGWLYKSAEELESELMGFRSAKTISRILNFLVSQGWLDSRNNPNFKWDKTYQYRVNILQLQIDLQKLGYVLEGYKPLNLAFLKMSNRRGNDETSKGTKCPIEKDKMSYRRGQNVGAIPEITTEKKEEEEEERGASQNDFEVFNHSYPDENNTTPEQKDINSEIIAFEKFAGLKLTGAAHKAIYLNWRKEGFSPEMILKAAELMCQLSRAPNLKYIDQTLQEWKRLNIRTLIQAEKLIKEFKSKQKTNSSAKKSPEAKKLFSDFEIYTPPDYNKKIKGT